MSIHTKVARAGGWCMWTQTSYSSNPYQASQTSFSLDIDRNYRSYWNRPASSGAVWSMVQTKLGGSWVGCTLSNYGSGSANRTAGRFSFNYSNAC